MVKARIIVRGNVQGVGFKAWVKLFARRLGIRGLVRNVEDGSVESFLEGSRQAVEEFVKSVGVRGVPDDPLSLHVEEVEVYWEGKRGYKPAWKGCEGFEIGYGTEELKAGDKEMLESLEWIKLHFTGMSRVVREGFASMKKVFREELEGLRGEFKEMCACMKEMHEDLEGEAAGIRAHQS